MLEMLTKKRNKKRKGFTLVELIVVIAILGILMLIAVPRFAGFREDAALKADQASAATIGKAAELYLIDNDDFAKNEIELKVLKDADLLAEEDIKPQAKGAESFKVEVDKDDKVTVSYAASSGVEIGGKTYTQLYPAVDPKEKTN